MTGREGLGPPLCSSRPHLHRGSWCGSHGGSAALQRSCPLLLDERPQPQCVPPQQEKEHPMTEPRMQCQDLMGPRTLFSLSPRPSPAPPSVSGQPAHIGELTPHTSQATANRRGHFSLSAHHLPGANCAGYQSLTMFQISPILQRRQWRLREAERLLQSHSARRPALYKEEQRKRPFRTLQWEGRDPH